MCGCFCIGFIDFLLAGKKLTDYTNLFSPHDFKKNNKINEINKINLSEQREFRLYEIKIENYSINEINETKLCCKKLNKYVIFNYICKILTVLGATSGGLSIISFLSAIGAPAGIASAGFTLIFSVAT